MARVEPLAERAERGERAQALDDEQLAQPRAVKTANSIRPRWTLDHTASPERQIDRLESREQEEEIDEDDEASPAPKTAAKTMNKAMTDMKKAAAGAASDMKKSMKKAAAATDSSDAGAGPLLVVLPFVAVFAYFATLPK